MLDNAALKDPGHKKLLTPDVKRRAVQSITTDHGLSEIRACRLAELDLSTFQYEKQAADDEALRTRLRELASERRRSDRLSEAHQIVEAWRKRPGAR